MPYDKYRVTDGIPKALTIKLAGPFPLPDLEVDCRPALAPGRHLHEESIPPLLRAGFSKNRPPG
jgi:hypothetical protein